MYISKKNKKIKTNTELIGIRISLLFLRCSQINECELFMEIKFSLPAFQSLVKMDWLSKIFIATHLYWKSKASQNIIVAMSYIESWDRVEL